MNKIAYILIITLLLHVSCNSKKENNADDGVISSDSLIFKKKSNPISVKDTLLVDSNKKTNLKSENNRSGKDSIPSFNVDNYPITNAMFKSANFLEKPVLSFDGLWFSHRNQTIAIALYTDYYRYAIFHFENKNIPPDLIDQMELHKPPPDSDTANLNLKKNLFLEVFPKINKVDSSYFRTNKGFQLGDPKSKALEIYGPPDLQKMNQGTEILYWEFIGDTFYDVKNDLKGKPLARNSFGHQIRMYFKNEKLIGLFLHNDIP